MTALAREIRKKWKRRPARSHKGDYGRVFILAGSRGLTGAAHLAGMGAVRTGAGLVTVGCPDAVYPIIARREAEVMVRPFPSTRQGSLAGRAFSGIMKFSQGQDVLALGPGLSQDPRTQKLVRRLIEKTCLPLVIDADALNALAGHPDILSQCAGRAVLTPHPGEFRRLFGRAVSSEDSVRRKYAGEAAKKYAVTVVLKGHRTVVASEDGKVFCNSTGNPGMATGGTGDVLTGVIAALIGQGFGMRDAARFGVYLHGLAGDLSARKKGQVSLAAGDLLDGLPDAIKKTVRF